MKKFIRTLFLIAIGPLLITSCSQSKEALVQKGPKYRYSKVYEGNKILYRDLEENDNDHREVSQIANKDREVKSIPEEEKSFEQNAAKAPVSADKDVKEEGGSKKLVNNFVSNLQEATQNFKAGRIFYRTKDTEHIKSADGSISSEDHTSATSTGDIFAILGFVFGLVGFLGSGLGIAASILGLVFSILGLNSSLRIFALIGLIVSIISLVVAIILI